MIDERDREWIDGGCPSSEAPTVFDPSRPVEAMQLDWEDAAAFVAASSAASATPKLATFSWWRFAWSAVTGEA